MSNLEFTSVFARICGNCGTDTRHQNGHCKLCTRAEVRAWKEANPEKQAQLDGDALEFKRAKNRDYAKRKYEKNPETQKAASAKWLKANKVVASRSSMLWTQRNYKKVQANMAAYYEKNKEKIAAYHVDYKSKNRNRIKAIDSNYRARKLSNGGRLSSGLADKLFGLQKGLCVCCKLPLGTDYHLDHIIPLALGGPNTDENIQLLRSNCNIRKRAKHPIDFMQERGFLL